MKRLVQSLEVGIGVLLGSCHPMLAQNDVFFPLFGAVCDAFAQCPILKVAAQLKDFFKVTQLVGATRNPR